jgi:hypothetical protein
MLHYRSTPLISEPGEDRQPAASQQPIPPTDEAPEAPTTPAGEQHRTPEDATLDPATDGTLPPGDAGIATPEQPPAAIQPDRPAGWRLALLPSPADLPPVSGGSTSGDAEIPLEERTVLAGTYCFATWFAHNSVRARGLMEEVPEFKKVYSSPNALGTLLGKGVAGHGLGLFRRGDAYPPTYANGWQLAQRLTATQFEQVARRLGFDGAEALAAAIRNLPQTHP